MRVRTAAALLSIVVLVSLTGGGGVCGARVHSDYWYTSSDATLLPNNPHDG